MLSDQIRCLVDQFDSDRAAGVFDDESNDLRKKVYTEAFEKYAGEPKNIQVAKAYAEFLSLKKVKVREFDLFAGDMHHFDLRPSCPVAPITYPTAGMVDAARTSFASCVKYLPGNEAELHDFLDLMSSGMYTHTCNGHVTVGFNYYVKTGFPEYRRQIISGLDIKDRPQDEMDELQGMLLIIDAAILYCENYSAAAFKAADETGDEAYRYNLWRIGESCRRLAEGPPETFFDALQGILLLQELLIWESAAISISIGRLDQILFPLYEKSGISFDEAQDLIYAFNIKLSSLVEAYQNVMICGIDKDGRFAGNDVSVMLLRAAKNLSYDQPQLCMRYTEGMPEEFWEEALETIATGHGFPAIFNDRIVIEAKRKAGVAPEDVWDYSASGCVEMSYGGRELCNTELIRINWLKVLELILNDGYCRYQGRSYEMGEKTSVKDIKTYEQLKERYKKELAHFIKVGTNVTSQIETVYYKCFPTQMLSITIDGCIEKGREAANFGAKYTSSGIINTGMANVVDSLMAIKKVVFEEERISLEEFIEVLNNDFADNEVLHAYCRNRCEKFGNDLEEPDALMQELMDYATAYEASIPNKRNGFYMPAAYAVGFHAHMGAKTAASADGRPAGLPLANSTNPCQGVDVNGPTAVINGVTRFDHTMFSDGMALDLKFSSTFFNNPGRRRMFRDLVDTYFKQGGMEVQFNVVDRETLLDAQQNPEKHQNLLVRVSGFSAYFVTLHKELQDEIIARTEYA